MLVTQRFDDGSTYTYDDLTDTTVAATDSAGRPVSIGSANYSAIASQAWSLFNDGVRALFEKKYGAEIATQRAAAAGAQTSAVINSVMPVLLLAGGGFLAFKLLKG